MRAFRPLARQSTTEEGKVGKPHAEKVPSHLRPSVILPARQRRPWSLPNTEERALSTVRESETNIHNQL